MKIRNEILAIIAAGEFDGPNFRITAGQLDRKVYQEVAKVIDAAGGKWNKRAKALVFDGDAAEALEPVLLTGEVTHHKQEFGQFDTPEALADRVVDEAGIRAGMFCLEPSCGIGNIVAAMEKRGAIVKACEVDAKRRAKVQERCVIAGGLQAEDFLLAEPQPVFDAIGMNPPFAKRADVLHVSHAIKFLRPGGRLVAIMSAGVTFRQDRAAVAFRDLVQISGGTIEALPEDSFKSSGTSVNTVLVTINA